MNENTASSVYCGHEYPEGTPTSKAEALTEHVQQCEKHPMAVLRKKYEIVRAALVNLVGVDTRKELEEMELFLRAARIPMADNAAAIDGVHALLATLEEQKT